MVPRKHGLFARKGEKTTEDTIYAPSSAIGGAVAVLRVSGADAAQTVRLLDRDVTRSPRMLLHARAIDRGEIADDCMAVFFPAPHTYTGEDMLELHCHGGVQTVQKLLSMLGALGFRPAEPGEFTKRAFLNGKMDLAQAEAVMDVINAGAEQSRRAAVLQLQGSVSALIHGAEELLLDALSAIDAAIDYPDEAEADALDTLPLLLLRARDTLSELVENGLRGRVLRDGLRIAILGRPNAGKSSLLNALLGEERAIVTAHAGTTRDVLDEPASFFGVPVRLVDTAGLREASDEAERIGVTRARTEMHAADICLVLLDGSAPLTAEDTALLDETAALPRIVLMSKCDLPADASSCACALENGALPVSAKTGEGLDRLREAVAARCVPRQATGTFLTNERHIASVQTAYTALCDAENAVELDCAATDVRDALHALGTITGEDADAAVIERIFARFCVGK